MDAQPIWRDYIYGYKEDTMPLLNDKIQGQVRKTLEDMAGPVKLAMFTQSSEALECEMCSETRGLLEEIAALAPAGKLSVEVHDFLTDADAKASYKIDKIPAIAVVGAKDYGIRLYGIPAGYEFSSLMDDILAVSKGESGLSSATKAALARVNQPIHIQVYVTPT
jgi:alkyl hydroperoxide reductase subunit AhpF